jgi:hypothetical protein
VNVKPKVFSKLHRKKIKCYFLYLNSTKNPEKNEYTCFRSFKICQWSYVMHRHINVCSIIQKEYKKWNLIHTRNWFSTPSFTFSISQSPFSPISSANNLSAKVKQMRTGTSSLSRMLSHSLVDSVWALL